MIQSPLLTSLMALCSFSLFSLVMLGHRRMHAEMQRQHCQPDSSMTFALIIVIIVFIICDAPRILWIGRGWSVGIIYTIHIHHTKFSRQFQDLTRFNKIAIQGTPQMAVDKEAICLSRVYSYYPKCNFPLFYV